MTRADETWDGVDWLGYVALDAPIEVLTDAWPVAGLSLAPDDCECTARCVCGFAA